MCFSEFIGYTCGHSSPEVLRPCPMTTQFYTNPLCTQHARRPILAPEMCPACQRVIHGRAVLITEWEHRWMHERGACGCEVQFPDLIRPRVVGRSHLGLTIGNNDRMRNNTPPSMNNGIAGASRPKTIGSNMGGRKKVPAHYQERSSKTGEDRPEVAPRRSPGAIYEVDPTKSTNKLYNLACKEGANITGLADCQSIEFPRPKGTLPLVGLPIGAGPEGPPEFSHVGKFQDCVLHTKNLIACIGDEPCRLTMKSKSFCCLRDSEAEDERLDQQGHSRQRTQSIYSSAESSGDSSADEDQLYLS
ncbi:hypothetical protein Daus18300_007159 [Diaporthe australafricana]|uniref:Uncharacterized protein n=1 Tax=Diaporthe australafricana TaxID=127596 RepID=A0ABR3WQ48_9PEZI